MKIKIIERLPIVNPPEIGSIHTVIKKEFVPNSKRTRLYLIKINEREIGVYPRECEIVKG